MLGLLSVEEMRQQVSITCTILLIYYFVNYVIELKSTGFYGLYYQKEMFV